MLEELGFSSVSACPEALVALLKTSWERCSSIWWHNDRGAITGLYNSLR